jgi:hypothetical protein
MRIYIDEAGTFVAQPAGQPLFSLVLAVVVPTSIETKLFDEFSGLLASWPHQGTEIKGSKLDESQAAQLVDIVSRYLEGLKPTSPRLSFRFVPPSSGS